MALWAGTALNTNALSSAVSKWWSVNAIPMVVKLNGLLYAMTGKTGSITSAAGKRNFRIESGISGNKLNVRLMGSLAAPAGLPDANQTDAITLTNDNDIFGAAEFEWAHFYHPEPIVASEYELIRGNEARTASFMQDKLEYVRKGWENVLGNGINSNDAPARDKIGGWRFAIEDGTNPSDNNGDHKYGTIDRSDAGNADFRGYQKSNVGALTLEDVDEVYLNVVKNGGEPDVGICGVTPYKKLLEELRGYTTYTDSTWDKFTMPKVGFMGMHFVMDQRAGETQMGLLSSKSFTLYLSGDTPKIHEAFQWKGVKFVLFLDTWVQLVCVCPSWNGKLSGITG